MKNDEASPQQPQKWGIIYCPKKGLRAARKRWRKIERALRDADVDFDYVQSEKPGSVERLASMFINNGYKTIVVVGGDSALNGAVNSLMKASARQREGIALGVVPNGLLNDFARFWDFREGETEQTIRWLKQRRMRKIDIGCIHYTDKEGESHDRHFVNCINIGLVAAIMNLRSETRRLLGSRTLSMAIASLLIIFQRMDYRMQLRINNTTLKKHIMTVCVGNCRGYGQTPSAVPYNGMLDVSVVSNPRITQLFAGFYLLLRNKILNHRSVHPFRTQRIDILAAPHAMVGIDGHLMEMPAGSYTITIEQEAVNFLIPE